MRRLYRVGIGFLSAALLVGICGCAATVDTSTLHPPYRISVYSNGKCSGERIVAADSEKGRRIVRWLAAHAGGWSPSMVSYAPSRLIRGQNFTLDVGSRVCVLNYQVHAGDQDWREVTRAVAAGDELDVFGGREAGR